MGTSSSFITTFIQLILLSATIDKPEMFAKWIEDEKNKQAITLNKPEKKVYLTSTNHRVVPLTHYYGFQLIKVIYKKSENTEHYANIKKYINNEITIKDTKNNFNINAYDDINILKQYLNKSSQKNVTRQFILNGLVHHLKNTESLPAICFVFSKKVV